MQIFNPYNPGVGPLPKVPTGGGTPTGVSAGAVSSTGGMLGLNGALLVPVFSNVTKRNYLALLSSTDFNCEEDCIYNFPQENIKIGYNVTSYKILVIYRNIGQVKLTWSITTFRQGLTTYAKEVATITPGKFYTKSKTMIIGSKPGDNRLYTIAFNIQNDGERPQLSVLRKANDGPMAIISATLIGCADVKEQM